MVKHVKTPPVTEPEAQPLDPTTTAFELLDKLDEVRQAAIDKLLEEKQVIEDKLHRLGWEAPPPVRVGQTPRTVPTKRPGGTKPCPVCGALDHDARRHRWDKKEVTPEAPPSG